MFTRACAPGLWFRPLRRVVNLNDWDKLSGIVASSFTVIAIIAGGMFALVEFYGYKQDKKISNSLGLVSEYYSEDVLQYRRKLDEAWETGHPILVETLRSRQDKAKAYDEYVIALVEKEELSLAIDYVMDFFERSVVCITAKLCDQATIDKFFYKNARIFFRKYYPYVCALRKKWKDDSIWLDVEAHFNPASIGKSCG